MENNNLTYILNRQNEGLIKSLSFEEWKAKAPNPDEIESDLSIYQALRKAGLKERFKKYEPAEVLNEGFVLEKKEFNLKVIYKRKNTFAIAASIVVLLTTGIAFWYKSYQDPQPTISDNSKPPIDSSEIEQHKALPPNKITTKDLVANNLTLPIENVPQKFKNAVNAINEDNIESGIKQLQAMNIRTTTPTESNGDDEIKFGSSGDKSVENTPVPTESLSREEIAYQQLYLGIAYLKKADYKKALKALENVTVKNIKGEAIWYKALAFLGQNDLEKAKAIATQVADDDSSQHQTEALLLIQDLQK
ncbi:hypothetical protein [Emticicia sp. W12TSBA100-4]|uniref:tetratricopeptide repeat protein n=1 Tax=Emticicia sp. W12TSBA100-4 TaxID=3160965 RepID=UPI00330583A7